ncbi:MAG: sortase [Ilumatobacter sp.]|uniref:sortase n=1 Tax=Ilumatobacter sp. TaxID=1967498 RepID=UPI002607394A|nr:sortase [Ilumatobacter sp.]MDJ0771319.1 sortase [Ilumatobacter sp.]
MPDPTETTHPDQVLAPHATEPFGRRRFIQGVGAVAGAGVLTSVIPDGLAHAAVPAGASQFKPLPTAIRIADTRDPSLAPYNQITPTRIRVKVAGRNGVPSNASAAVLTVTAVNHSQPNFVTVYPTGQSLPLVSNLNMMPGDVNANLATVKVGNNGHVDFYTLAASEVIVDVLGYYEPVDSAVREGRFVGLATAQRAIDTRPNLVGARSFTVVDVTAWVPAEASSVVINLTATETTGPGFFTALPYSVTTEPKTSSLNVTRAWDTRAAGVIVPVETVGGRRRIKVFTLTPAKIIVDIAGYFTGSTSSLSSVGLYVPLEPDRLLDTRDPGEIGRLWPNWVVEGKLPAAAAANASAIVANLTCVNSRGPGFLTISAARLPIPPTSNVNVSAPGAVVPNHVITPVTSQHGFQVLSSHGAHVIVDLAGYFTGSPKIPQLAQYQNPPPPAAPPEWVLKVPKIGLTSQVKTGSATAITNSGHSWHWAGTGFMGQEAHVSLFAHRTDAGGPYRYVHWLGPGDTWTVTTGDGREYTYRYVRRDLTNSNNSNILQATRNHPGTTLSLIACTVGYDRTKSAYPDAWAPTSLKYRIIVTGELVSWREL